MKLFRSRKDTIGLVPGTPVYVGQERTGPVTVSVFDFDADSVDERPSVPVEDCFPMRDSQPATYGQTALPAVYRRRHERAAAR